MDVADCTRALRCSLTTMTRMEKILHMMLLHPDDEELQERLLGDLEALSIILRAECEWAMRASDGREKASA